MAVQQQLALSDLDHGVPNARIPVGVVLHRVADDVGHLVETAVVHFTQAVQNAPLHGFQAVVLVRHCTLEDDVTGVVEEVVVVHATDRDHPLHLSRFACAFFPGKLVVALVALVVLVL